MTDVAVLLAQAREQARLTQRELSAAADVPQASVSRIERGLISPRATTIERWLEACGHRLRLQRVAAPTAVVEESVPEESVPEAPELEAPQREAPEPPDWAVWSS